MPALDSIKRLCNNINKQIEKLKAAYYNTKKENYPRPEMKDRGKSNSDSQQSHGLYHIEKPTDQQLTQKKEQQWRKLDMLFPANMSQNLSLIRQTADDRLLQSQLRQRRVEDREQSRIQPVTPENDSFREPHSHKAPYQNTCRLQYSQVQQLHQKAHNRNQVVDLGYRKFTQSYIKAFLQTSEPGLEPESSEVKSLYITWARMPYVIDLLHCRVWGQLRLLNLAGNLLQSVEPLAHIQLPHLQYLYLWSNHLVGIRPLNKCLLPALRVLDLHNNHITELALLRGVGGRALETVLVESNQISCFNQLFCLPSCSIKLKVVINSNRAPRIARDLGSRRKKTAQEVLVRKMAVKYL